MLLEDIGVARWEYDVWYRIIQAVLDRHPLQVDTHDFPGFDKRAASRYAATTPALLRWFRAYNLGKPYREQVRPFGFLIAFQSLVDPTEDEDPPRTAAPFDRDPDAAVRQAFDRATGRPVPADQLKTYRQALAQYQVHPESKFLNGDYIDTGETLRRHIVVDSVIHIGKEANRWEEQFYLGEDRAAQIVYGEARTDRDRADRANALNRAVILQDVKRSCQSEGVRRFARRAGVDPGHLSRVLAGDRPLGQGLASRLERY